GGAGLPPAHGSVSGNEPRRRSLLARPWTHRGDRQGGEATPLRAARRTAAVPAPGRRLERSQRAAHADRRRVARWTDLAVRAGPAERLLHERAADPPAAARGSPSGAVRRLRGRARGAVGRSLDRRDPASLR